MKSEAIMELEALRASAQNLLNDSYSADYCIGALTQMIRTLTHHIERLTKALEKED